MTALEEARRTLRGAVQGAAYAFHRARLVDGVGRAHCWVLAVPGRARRLVVTIGEVEAEPDA